MTDDDAYAREWALRRFPLPYSMALRLRDAGVADLVIGEYVGLEPAVLQGFYRISQAKLDAVRDQIEERDVPERTPRRLDTGGQGRLCQLVMLWLAGVGDVGNRQLDARLLAYASGVASSGCRLAVKTSATK